VADTECKEFIWTIHIFCKNWETVFEEKWLIFQEKGPVICQEIFQEVWVVLWSSMLALQILLQNKENWTAGEKWTLNSWWMQVSYAVSIKTAVLRNIIKKKKHCISFLTGRNIYRQRILLCLVCKVMCTCKCHRCFMENWYMLCGTFFNFAWTSVKLNTLWMTRL